MASQNIFPDWRPVFNAALLETNPKQLQERVLRAEDAIVARMQALVNDPKWRDGALLKMPFASCGLSK